MLDEYKLDVAGYFQFSRKLGDGELINENIDSVLAYLEERSCQLNFCY